MKKFVFTLACVLTISTTSFMAVAAESKNEPTPQQIEAMKKIPDKHNPNFQPKPLIAQCYFDNKWYNEGAEICSYNNKWRCGSSGQWYALGRTC